MEVKYLRVDEIVKTISETSKFNSDELYAVNTSDILEGDFLQPSLMKSNNLKGQFKKTIKNGDILFSEIRPANKRYALIKLKDTSQYVVSTKLMVLRKFNSEVDLNYFYYWLTNEKMLEILQSRAENRICSFPQITFELLSEYKVPIPNLTKQKKISQILLCLDNKINNNKNIIKELEQVSRTIYDYWFLQYEFPNEEGKPYKSTGGKMVWNEQLNKEIPEGWQYKKIIEIESNIITGKTPSTKDVENFNGEIPFITIDDIRQGLYVSKTIRTLSEKGANLQMKKYIPKDSICVTCIATIGLIGITTKNSQTNQQINSIVCKNKNNIYYLVSAISDYFKYSNGAKSGNIFNNMNKEDFADIKLLYPNENILKKYNKKVEPIYHKIKECILENEELKKLRDFLLPLFMNGQIKFAKK